MLKIKIQSVQDWSPIEEFFNNGIIKLKNGKFIKIIKITPINYELKSEFEKRAILNSYKTFLKNCNFEIQIIIQSNKEDISKNIKKIENQIKKEKSLNNNFIVNISKLYSEYIKEKNKEKISSSKNFYIVIRSTKSQENQEKNIIEKELKEKYFKIKDSLSRCGNSVCEIKEKKEMEKIIKSFLKVDL